MSQLSFVATSDALRDGVVAWRGTRAVIRVSGPDALSYLQGQLSQDIAAINPGESADALGPVIACGRQSVSIVAGDL